MYFTGICLRKKPTKLQIALKNMQTANIQEPTFQSLHRPLSYRFFNTLGSSLKAVGLPVANLNADSIIESAKKKTELDDFGDQDFHQPLAHLVKSLETEAQLNFVGRHLSRKMLTDLLSERLRVQRYIKQFPETLSERIEKPLFVIGMPRSGTSFLFTLLSQDPSSSSIKYWELFRPSQQFFSDNPSVQNGAEDALIKKSSQSLANTKRLLPNLDRVHSIEAEGPYECFHLLERGFISHTFGLYANVPSYLKWIESEFWEAGTDTPTNLYKYYYQQVQLIQNLRNRTQPSHTSSKSHWVFKSPVHLWSTEHISNVLPDVRFVHIHRDPLSVIPSICSFVAMGRAALSDKVDLHQIGKQALKRWSEAIDTALKVRQQKPSLRILDIHYKRFVKNPIETVREIYSYFDLDFTEEAEINLNKYLSKPSESGKGKHKYSLQQFGLNEEEVRESFSNYYQFMESL